MAEKKISIRIKGQNLVSLHRTASYKIVLENIGTTPVFHVQVSNTLSRHLEYCASTPGAIFRRPRNKNEAILVWKFDKIFPKSQIVIDVVVHARFRKRGERSEIKVHLAYKKKNEELLALGNANLYLTILPCFMPRLKENVVPNPVRVGKLITYEVEIENFDADDTLVWMRCFIPSEYANIISIMGPSSRDKIYLSKLLWDESYGYRWSIEFEVDIFKPYETRRYTITCKAIKEGKTQFGYMADNNWRLSMYGNVDVVIEK